LRRHGAVIAGGGIRDHIDLAIALRLGDGLPGPVAGIDVVDHAVRRRQVHWYDRKLRRGAALHEQHPVVGRNGQQLAQVRFGLGRAGKKSLAAVAELHHGSTVAAPVEQLIAGLLQDFSRQRGRTRGEIKRAHETPQKADGRSRGPPQFQAR